MSAVEDRADVERARAAADALASGGFVLLAESTASGAEGNLTIAAQFVTPAAVVDLAAQGNGVVRLCLSDERCRELHLDAIERSEEDWQPTAPIAHRSATGHGASAEDRARTIRAAVDPASKADDFVGGGYVFPLRARPGGVLRRSGRTEAAVDLVRLAGCAPAAAMSLLMNDDGTVATGAALADYAEARGIPFVTIGDVVALRRLSDKLVERVAAVRLPTRYGEFAAIGFRDTTNDAQHLALVKGEVDGADAVLVRVHAECLLGDVFGGTACNCRREIVRALELIEAEGRGVLLYIVQPARDQSVAVLDAHDSHGRPMDEYGIGAQILAELGLRRIRVLSDHPRTISGLEGFGLEIVEHVPLT